MIKTYKIKDLEQVKLLADPLKLQLLQAFAEDDKTTRQVADELNEGVTKLYRHVDALHAAGLLRVTSETRKRGTIERTFRAVAQRFEADHTLFVDPRADEPGVEAARSLLRAGEAEILASIAGDAPSQAAQPIFMRLRCKASPARIAALREALSRWIESVQEDEDIGDQDAQEIGALIAFYPVK